MREWVCCRLLRLLNGRTLHSATFPGADFLAWWVLSQAFWHHHLSRGRKARKNTAALHDKLKSWDLWLLAGGLDQQEGAELVYSLSLVVDHYIFFLFLDFPDVVFGITSHIYAVR